jgi:hypothetical protein
MDGSLQPLRASVPTEPVSLPVAHHSHPTGEEVTDAWIAGFLHAIGREPWEDMHDYAAVCGLEYAKVRVTLTGQLAIDRIAAVSAAVGRQSGVPALEIAGMVVSFLHANPEHVARFLVEGSELFVDGTIDPKAGSLSYRSQSDEILTPSDLRARTGVLDQ